VRLVGGVDQLAPGGDDVDRHQVVACGAVHLAGERRAAAEQVAADTDGRACPGREVEAVLGEGSLEHAAPGARADPGDARLGVDLDAVERGEIEEQAAIAHRVGGPGVAAGADPDRPPVRARQPNRLYHRLVVAGERDRVRVASRPLGIEDRGVPRCLVALFPAAQDGQVRPISGH
jgi:hypothetical protein